MGQRRGGNKPHKAKRRSNWKPRCQNSKDRLKEAEATQQQPKK